MKALKKAKSVLALALIMSVGVSAFPQKSEAGFLFGVAGAASDYSAPGFGIIAVTLFITGLVYDSPELILLNNDGSMKSQLTVNLAKELNTINDMNLIAELAETVTQKYEAQKANSSGKVLVTLSNAELSQIIANSSEVLSLEQIELLRKVAQ